MLASPDWLAIDTETAPNKTELDRLADLMRAKAEMAGQLKAARKLKAPPAEIAALAAAGKRLTAEIKYARTAGLDPHRAHIRLLQVYAGANSVLVIDLDKTGAGVLELLDGVNVIAHNVAFDLAFLEAAGVALGGMQCTMQAVRLSLGEHTTSLAAAARAYLNVDLDKSQQISDWNAPDLTPEQIDYAAIDAVVAWRIAEKILPRFEVQRSAYEIQIGAVPAAMRMEQRGFKLDVEAHAKLIADLGEERLAAEQDYCEACQAGGHTTLIRKAPTTPAQKQNLLEVLLSSEELQRWRRTEKSGALSTKRSELLRAGHYPPILALVKLSPHRQDAVLVRADAGGAGVPDYRPDPRALSDRQHGIWPSQLLRSESAASPTRPAFPRAVRSRARLHLRHRRLQLRWSCAPPRTSRATTP